MKPLFICFFFPLVWRESFVLLLFLEEEDYCCLIQFNKCIYRLVCTL